MSRHVVCHDYRSIPKPDHFLLYWVGKKHPNIKEKVVWLCETISWLYPRRFIPVLIVEIGMVVRVEY